jgi:hypothetical protein
MDLQTDKKKYIKPITESINMIFENFMSNSPENYSEYIDDGNDDWGNVKPPDPDPDEEIDW